MPSGRLTPSKLLAREKQRRALALRQAGASYRQIAEDCDYYDASAARKAILSAFDEVIQEPVEELRKIQIERLNHMLLILWPKVQKGDNTSIRDALSVMSKMDQLMGTDAPQQISHKVEAGVLVIEGTTDDYLRALAELSGEDPAVVLGELEEQRAIEASAQEVPPKAQSHVNGSSSSPSTNGKTPAKRRENTPDVRTGSEVPFIPLEEEDE